MANNKGIKISSLNVWDKASRRRHLHLGHEGKAQVYDPNI
jgi:hypothetical protein